MSGLRLIHGYVLNCFHSLRKVKKDDRRDIASWVWSSSSNIWEHFQETACVWKDGISVFSRCLPFRGYQLEEAETKDFTTLSPAAIQNKYFLEKYCNFGVCLFFLEWWGKDKGFIKSQEWSADQLGGRAAVDICHPAPFSKAADQTGSTNDCHSPTHRCRILLA